MDNLHKALSEIVDQELSADKLEHYFVNVAKILLLQNLLMAGNVRFRILEIEFYFHSRIFHADPYSHFSQYPNSVRVKQSVIGSWYFHRFTGIAKYTHTRRGVDLTFGNGDQQRYGGILIRTIERLDDGLIISGPSRVVAELISAINNPMKIEEIGFDTTAGLAFQETCALHLKACKTAWISDVYCSPRFGLGDKDPEYKEKHYRFFTDVSAIRKPKDFRYLIC